MCWRLPDKQGFDRSLMRSSHRESESNHLPLDFRRTLPISCALCPLKCRMLLWAVASPSSTQQLACLQICIGQLSDLPSDLLAGGQFQGFRQGEFKDRLVVVIRETQQPEEHKSIKHVGAHSAFSWV